MEYDYLIRISDSIADTIFSQDNLHLEVGKGLVFRGEFHNITKLDYYVDADRRKFVYFVDIEYIPIENVPSSIQTKMLWDADRDYR